MVPWANPTQHPKWHLDQFSHFCTAHSSSESLYFTMGRPSPSKFPLCKGNLDPCLICASSAPPSAHPKWHLDGSPFLHTSRQTVPIFYNGPPLPPWKLPFPMDDLDPHLTVVPWAQPIPHPKQSLDWFSHFCRAHGHYTQTDRPHYPVCSNRLYLHR